MASLSSPTPNPTIAIHLQPYQLPPSSFPEYFIDKSSLNANARSRLVASAVVIHSSRVLLLQRAAHSFQPLLWELPGGRCESRDESVIASAVRELWEESGLVASRVTDVVGEYGWLDGGEKWKKITFLVGVEHDGVLRDRFQTPPPQVTIDPNEQESFIWATEEDVIANQCGGIALEWTSEEQKETVLDAFKLVK